MIDVNLKGVYYCMKHEVVEMRKTGGGSIINQSSITSSITGTAENGLYGATKAGIIGLTKSAALQVCAENISINALATAGFDIPNDVFIRWIDEHGISREQANDWFPAGRLGSPEEIAAAVLYMASDEARFMVGAVVVIDGGLTSGEDAPKKK
jgi:NAD(P)-dependent dehydrogenase (short-subunit alcohol dehydrogenase family)